MEVSTPNNITRAYTRCRYGQLHYRSAGSMSDKPALILLHQNPSSSREFERLIAAMATDRLVVAFDTPGAGGSDPPPEALSIVDYVAAFADGLNALGLDNQAVDVFGFHSGTYLAVELALQWPQTIRRVVLSGIPMRTPQECAENLALARAIAPAQEDGEDIFTWLHWLWDYLVVKRHRDVPVERAVEAFAEVSRQMHRRGWVYQGVWSYPAAERLPGLTQPTLVLQPHEPLLEPSRAAAQLIPRACFVELEALSRDIFEVGVPQLAEELRRFLG
jgi:pimeloyl-ACP methyl ester carboxylesterase